MKKCIFVLLAASIGFCQAATPASSITFDLAETVQTFEGFGAMVWQGDPKIEQLQELYNPLGNVRYARINHETRGSAPLPIGGSFDDYEAYWIAYGDKSAPPLGAHVRFILLGTIPGAFKIPKDTGTQLASQYCDDLVLYQAAGIKHFGLVNGNLPSFTEICNEPDGSWSCYVSPGDYGYLLQKLGSVLSEQGLSAVGIIGPGVAHLDWKHGDAWTDSLSSAAVSALYGWSVHAWIWAKDLFGRLVIDKEGGQAAIRDYYPNWYAGAKEKNASLPVLVTEFSADATAYHGISYPAPALGNTRSAAYTVPFGARAYNNAITLLTSGACAAVYWQAADQSWGTGGTSFIDLSGNFTPVYLAFTPLFSMIPAGAKVLKTESQGTNDIFAAAFLSDNTLTAALANCSAQIRKKTVTLKGVGGVASAVAKYYHQGADVFSPILEEVDISILKDKNSNYFFNCELLPDSTLTVQIQLGNP